MTDLNLKVGDLVQLRNGEYSIVIESSYYNEYANSYELTVEDLKNSETEAVRQFIKKHGKRTLLNNVIVYGNGQYYYDLNWTHPNQVVRNLGCAPKNMPIFFENGEFKVYPNAPDYLDMLTAFNTLQSQQMYM